MTLSREEKYELEILQQFCDIICDHGKWKRMEGELRWCVEEEAADRAFQLLEGLDD